jgi:hypothetical protein
MIGAQKILARDREKRSVLRSLDCRDVQAISHNDAAVPARPKRKQAGCNRLRIAPLTLEISSTRSVQGMNSNDEKRASTSELIGGR